MNVHLIDGTYELFRAHFGAPSASDKNGREVGATRGLIRSMAALLTQPDVTHVAAAFDTVIESFRNALFHGYKTGEGLPEELVLQFPLAERALAALGIVVWSMIEFEADDALATAAHQLNADARVTQVLLCSPDKDLAQCVIGDRIIGYDRMRERRLNEPGVLEKFGVPPSAIPDWLALVGDTADGIPGIARWGAKGAAIVLSHYGSLDAIPNDPAAWQVAVRGAATLAENLARGRQDARLFRTLATLRRDVPLDAAVEALAWRGPAEELPALLDELQMGPSVGVHLSRVWERCRALNG